MDLERKVEVASREIRFFAEKWSGVYIAFSGGKDSTVLLHLAVEALPPRLIRGVVFVEVTGNTHPMNIRYVHDVVDRLGLSDKLMHLRREDMDFFQAMEKWGVPGFKHRWCYREFKLTQFTRVKPAVYIVGVKHSDSNTRAMWNWSKPKNMYGNFLMSPIWFWTDNDVHDYMKSRSIPLNPCYRVYLHSGNCMFCPFHTKPRIRAVLADDQWAEKILSTLSKIRNEYGRRIYRLWVSQKAEKLTKWIPR